MIFSPEGVVSSEDYEYQIKAVCKMVSNRDHAFGAADLNERGCLLPRSGVQDDTEWSRVVPSRLLTVWSWSYSGSPTLALRKPVTADGR